MIMEISESVWYTFATVTTIGFGDVIAGVEYNDHCLDNGSDYDLSHQTNAIFWVINYRSGTSIVDQMLLE